MPTMPGKKTLSLTPRTEQCLYTGNSFFASSMSLNFIDFSLSRKKLRHVLIFRVLAEGVHFLYADEPILLSHSYVDRLKDELH